MQRSLPLLAALLLAPLALLHAAEPVVIDLNQRTWQGIPGLERTAKGRVYVSWFMWIDPKGRLWYIFNRGNKDLPKHDVWARICDDPDAAKPQWGPEFRIGYDAPFTFRMNKVTVLSTGEWIMPVTLAEKPVRAWCTGYNEKQIPTLHGVGISADEGRTWTLHGAVKSKPWALENMIVELKDGRLWMLIRTNSGVLWQSHSTDKGRTWSEGNPSTIKSPGSRFYIRRLSSGNLLLVNHHKFTGRSHLTAQLSTDDGATWNDGLLLDERGGVSYPDGVQDRDGLIWITYDRDRNGAGEILLAKFREEDVATGKDVSGAVTLKQPIDTLSKPAQPPELLPADWDPKAAADKVMAGLIKVTAPQVKGAHDAEFVCVGDRAYVVEHDNDVASIRSAPISAASRPRNRRSPGTVISTCGRWLSREASIRRSSRPPPACSTWSQGISMRTPRLRDSRGKPPIRASSSSTPSRSSPAGATWRSTTSPAGRTRSPSCTTTSRPSRSSGTTTSRSRRISASRP